MKTKITLSFLVVLFCTVNVFAQKKLFFVGNTATTAPLYVFPNCDARDTTSMNKLKAQGFTLSFAGDDETKPAATQELKDAATAKMNEADIVLVSSTVGSGDVAAITTAAVNAGKPVLAWEYGVFDEMKMMVNTSNRTTGVVTSATINPTIDSKIRGSLTTFEYITAARGVRSSTRFTQGAGVVNIANMTVKNLVGDTNADSLLAVAQYLKLGDSNSDGVPATASVISFPMFDNDNTTITAEGWELFLRCVCFLGDKAYIATGVKDVASYDVNAKIWYANGNLNMDIWKNLKNSQLSIYNTEGKMISKTQISGFGLISIPVSNLKSGLYMVVGEGFKGKFIKN